MTQKRLMSNPTRLVGGTRTAWREKQLKKLKALRLKAPVFTKRFILFVRMTGQEKSEQVGEASNVRQLLHLLRDCEKKEGFLEAHIEIR